MSEIMKTQATGTEPGDMQNSFTLCHELLGERCSIAVGPASAHSLVVDDGEGSEHSCSHQRRPPDSGAEQGPTQWFADCVGVDGCFGWDWIPVQVLADDWR